MADRVSDGNIRVAWVPETPGIADQDAPTVAELTAATTIDLSCRLTPDGLSITTSTDSIDTAKLCSTFNTLEVGRRSYEIEITLVRGTVTTAGGDDEWHTAIVFRSRGFLVVRRGVAYDTAWTVDDEVEVYPVTAGAHQEVAPAANTLLTVTIPLMMNAEPNTGDNPAIAA